MAETVIVTGVNGFVGNHLTAALKDQGFDVVGLGFGKVDVSLNSLLDDYRSLDFTDSEALKKLDLPPAKAAIHLAGLASQAQSFDQPQKFITQNPVMLVNLCENLRSGKNKNARVVVISSGAIYDSNQTMPLAEDSKVAVNSPYTVSKLSTELVAQYYRTIGLDCVIARPMNHIGPGQLPGFLLPDLTAHIKGALAKNQPVTVGNLKTRRDYTDVRDVVQAYVKLATGKLNHDLYNICSGKSVAGEEILQLILKKLAPDKEVKVEVDESRIRPTDPPEIYGSFDRLKADTGWQPTIPLEQTVTDFIEAIN